MDMRCIHFGVYLLSLIELRLSRSALEPLLRAIKARLRELELEIEVTKKRIEEYEARHGMTSKEFLEKYERGKLGDNEDYVAWYGEPKFLELAKREYEELLKVMNNTRRKVSETN